MGPRLAASISQQAHFDCNKFLKATIDFNAELFKFFTTQVQVRMNQDFQQPFGQNNLGQLIQSFVNTRLLRCVFRIQLDIYNGTFLQKGSTVDVRLGSKYASVPYKCNHKLSLSSIGIDDSCFAMKFLSVYIPSGV